MNLRFTLGYKGDFKVRRIALDSANFASDDVDGFVDELSTFEEFKRPFATCHFAKPTDIISGFGLESNVSGYIFTEQDHDLPVAVDKFGIDIRVPIFDSATCDCRRFTARPPNDKVECLGSISPM